MAGPNDLVAGGQSDCSTTAAVGLLDHGGRTPCCWPRGHLFDVGYYEGNITAIEMGLTGWDELFKECAAALDGGAVLNTKNLEAITDSIRRAFATMDANLSTWLQQMDKEDDSGATATALFLRNDVLVVSHIGDSCLVISRGGRPQSLTNFHRPYGNNKTSLEEVKRIRAAGGWVCFLFHSSAELPYLNYLVLILHNGRASLVASDELL
ncbi:unnamed protein product [Triticum turgidum subsp. durum]|uniref:protein-serine/threonine phosphatase n=1 Tax=Triticum turgidum subsp. durum TaxID=4567 RepID=A0A9R0RJF3_TRITD|nr:unnamed protein product [Triticum turgidum subsp. durum]